MLSTLIVSHGGLARELLASAQTISGETDRFEALSLDWSDGPEEVKNKIGAALRRLDLGDGVLVLVDTYGGTPHKAALALAEAERVEVVSGVNLPMVMRLACLGNRQQTEPRQAAEWLQEKGRAAIRVGCSEPECADSGGARGEADGDDCA